LSRTLFEELFDPIKYKGGRMNDLKGHFFHSYNKDGLVEWQGKVISNPEPGIYLVQLYEWFVGAESCRKLVNIQDMIQWSFYETNKEMANSYYSKKEQ
jgi:hypothetical protein